ncbi:MAG TPA: hypothetical protein VI076_02445 [Actinopolymorphaceae bacterium]
MPVGELVTTPAGLRTERFTEPPQGLGLRLVGGDEAESADGAAQRIQQERITWTAFLEVRL